MARKCGLPSWSGTEPGEHDKRDFETISGRSRCCRESLARGRARSLGGPDAVTPGRGYARAGPWQL